MEITDTAKLLKDIIFKDKTCLVIGNEQYGIPQNIMDKCDDSYYIDYFSVASREAALALNEQYDGWQIEREYQGNKIFFTF